MQKELPPQYNPQEVEDKIYRLWEKSGYFNPDNLSRAKKPYCIMVPPPNITGELHMGHALNAAIQDILIRKKRMEGYKTLWLPGTDHAGIATQNVVEREMKREGLTREDLGPEKFLEKVWVWKEKYGNLIRDQFKKLGSSMDWSRARFTMDPEYQEAVKTAFLHYYKKGWIYRAKKVINWCPRCLTSLSDLELEHREVKGILYYINYPLADGSGIITVSTTRPETMLGDTAVSVRPDDKRYKHLIGKEVILPLKNRRIPVVGDRSVDPKFGTGVVKVTPAHDILDAEIAERHRLPAIKIIGINGRMSKEAGPICMGLTVSECRKKVVEDLRTQKFLEREESYVHNVAQCYRCAAQIEPLPSMQWFLKMNKLAEAAIRAVKSEKVRFHPKRWEKVYFDWLKNVRDWTISRQIWWGHKIPLEGVEDVLDTWFSSALWPFAALGWPIACVQNQKSKIKNQNYCRSLRGSDLYNFYPTQILSTARDIINLWVARMVFSGLEFMGREPFKNVIIHPTILTREGRRMSKSLGTGVNPMDLISRYGADATRFGLIWQAMGNQDIHWNEEHVTAGRKFCNKIWNSARFVLTQIGNSEFRNSNFEIDSKFKIQNSKFLTAADKKILRALKKVKKETDIKIEKYEFGKALHALYDFYWHEFCDMYIEKAKGQLGVIGHQVSTGKILLHVLTESLKLLHPFIPFITEEIWRRLPIKNKSLLLMEKWPK